MRHRRRNVTVLAALALLLPALAACGDDDGDAGGASSSEGQVSTTTEAAAASGIEVTDVWARQVQDRGAVYLDIIGGDTPDALLKASVPADIATTVELHETVGGASGGSTDAEGQMEGGTEAEDGVDGMAGGSGQDPSTAADDQGAMSQTTTSMAGDMDGSGDDGTMGGGMMQMQPVDRIEVPAGATVSLRPGGLHIMLLDVQRTLAPGDTFEVTLTFEEAGETTVTAEVREV